MTTETMHPRARRVAGVRNKREDRYFRLAEIDVNVPALPSRREGDLVLLASVFLKRFARNCVKRSSIMVDAQPIDHHGQ